MSLTERIATERSRLALAKAKLRERRGERRKNSVVSDKCHEELVRVSSNRRFDAKSPRSKGVSVKVHFNASKGRQTENNRHDERTNTETDRRARLDSSRETALFAKTQILKQKLDFAEKELTIKADLCATLQSQLKDLESNLGDTNVQFGKLKQEKLDALGERDIARQRVIALTERLSSTEKAFHETKNELQQVQLAALDQSQDMEEEKRELERRVVQLNETIKNLHLDLETYEHNAKADQARARKAELDTEQYLKRCSSLEQELQTSQVTRRSAEEETDIQRRQIEDLQEKLNKSADLSKALEEATLELSNERERAKSLEKAFAHDLETARKTAMETATRLKDALNENENIKEQAKKEKSDHEKTIEDLRKKLKHSEATLARVKLSASTEADQLKHKISLLMKEKVQGLSTIQIPDSGGRPPAVPEISKSQFEEEEEELVIDITLPSGVSKELLVRTDQTNISEVVKTFSQENNLSPRGTLHLEEYVFSQLPSSSRTIQERKAQQEVPTRKK